MSKKFRPSTPPPCTWLLYGSYFRLPITVKWGQYDYKYCQVKLHSGLSLLKVQKAAAEQLLSEHALGRDDGGWSFDRAGIAQLAVPVQGEPDVETLLRWDTDELIYELPLGDDWSCMAGNGRATPAVVKRVRQFLNRFVDRVGLAGFADFGELECFYYLLCNFMMRYLQSGTEPVDLVFCQLFANPFKPNWLYKRKRKQNPWRAVGTQPIGGGRRLRRHLGWRWRIGVILNYRWTRTEAEYQSKLREIFGEYGYAKKNRERIDKISPSLEKVLKEWYDAAKELPLSDTMARFKNVRISPRTGKIWKLRSPASGRRARARKAVLRKEQNNAAAMGSADAAVSQMPDFQQAASDLRDAGGADGKR